jgi:hypothetical protein
MDGGRIVVSSKFRQCGCSVRGIYISVLHCLLLFFPALHVLLLNSLSNLLVHDPLETSFDLASAIIGQSPIGGRNIMP